MRMKRVEPLSRINLNFFSEKVKRMAGVKNVVAITSAKVPIIKLFHTQVINNDHVNYSY